MGDVATQASSVGASVTLSVVSALSCGVLSASTLSCGTLSCGVLSGAGATGPPSVSTLARSASTVSYTHLDVYKRQTHWCCHG